MKRALAFILTLTYTSVFSQQHQKLYFVKNDLQEVLTRDKADFVRYVRSIETYPRVLIYEYYKNDSLKRVASAKSFQPTLILDGPVKEYHPNGRLAAELHYKNAIPVGLANYYYPNGQLKKTVEMLKEIKRTDTPWEYTTPTRLISFYTPQGRQVVVNGCGYVQEEEGSFICSGKYTNGFKDSVWTGCDTAGSLRYEEEYVNGALACGKSFTPQKTYEYTETKRGPHPKAGFAEFYRNVCQNFEVPSIASRNKVEGMVLISLAIDTLGNKKEIKVIQHPGYKTGEAAITALKNAGNWLPALERGMPVASVFTLPIQLRSR